MRRSRSVARRVARKTAKAQRKKVSRKRRSNRRKRVSRRATRKVNRKNRTQYKRKRKNLSRRRFGGAPPEQQIDPESDEVPVLTRPQARKAPRGYAARVGTRQAPQKLPDPLAQRYPDTGPRSEGRIGGYYDNVRWDDELWGPYPMIKATYHYEAKVDPRVYLKAEDWIQHTDKLPSLPTGEHPCKQVIKDKLKELGYDDHGYKKK